MEGRNKVEDKRKEDWLVFLYLGRFCWSFFGNVCVVENYRVGLGFWNGFKESFYFLIVIVLCVIGYLFLVFFGGLGMFLRSLGFFVIELGFR